MFEVGSRVRYRDPRHGYERVGTVQDVHGGFLDGEPLAEPLYEVAFHATVRADRVSVREVLLIRESELS